MLPAIRIPKHAASRCIYCDFRSQQLALQFRRSRSTQGSKEDSTLPFLVRGSSRHRDRPKEERLSRRPGAGRELVRSSDAKLGPGSRTVFGNDRGKETRRRETKPGTTFEDALEDALVSAKEDLKDAPIVGQLAKEAAEIHKKPLSFGRIWSDFRTSVFSTVEIEQKAFFGNRGGQRKVLLKDLSDAYSRGGKRGLNDRIKYAFYDRLVSARFDASDIGSQKALADLRYPSEWFPAARIMRRTIHLHVGPTNSGKTYQALKRLEQAGKGVYAGPLRLLAHEVYARMNAKGIACRLTTGEERRLPPDGLGDDWTEWRLNSCTVEMLPINTTMDVAVIDEIQMIGDPDRGWAWTSSLLGVRAKEVHLCGEERAVPLVREICASLGEKLEIHRYERLSPLKVAEESLDGKLTKLRKGDCVVAFSVMGIHALRQQIEQITGRKVATVYGSLPPETRAQQARLFNDPNNDYDILVASDAVGMGLNLAIKRIVFDATAKFDGAKLQTLSVADIKQIAGRAGRYRTAALTVNQPESQQDVSAAKGDHPPVAGAQGKADQDNVGYVTTLEKFDYPVMAAAMETQPPPVRSAGIYPPVVILDRFASYFPPATPFSYLLRRMHELSTLHKRYHLCSLKDQTWLADLIEPIRELTISDRYSICACPASSGEAGLWKELMPAYARIIAGQGSDDLTEIKELPLEVLEMPVSGSKDYLRELERLHKGLVGYLWLSYRFAGLFAHRPMAFHVKTLTEKRIEEVLGSLSFTHAKRKLIVQRREKLLMFDLDGGRDTEEKQDPGGLEDREESAASAGPREGGLMGEDRLYEAMGAEGESKGEGEGEGEGEGGDRLREQGSLIAGREGSSGEEDIDFEGPEEAEGLFSQQSSASAQSFGEDFPGELEELVNKSSFAEWRSRQTRGESQASHEPELHHGSDSLDAGQAVEEEEEPPARGEAESPSTTPSRAKDGKEPGFPGVPLKHLGDLDVSAREMERDVTSRP